MQVVLVIFSVVLLCVIINYAVSPKSSRLLKMAALIALGLIALSLGVASVILAINSFSEEADEERLPIFLEAQKDAPKDRGNWVEIIAFLLIVAALVTLIAVETSKDRKKKLAEAKKAGASPIYQNAGKQDDLELKGEEAPVKAKDDEFDLNM